MRHIKESKRRIGRVNRFIWSTDDSNILIETFTEKREIHLDKLVIRKKKFKEILLKELEPIPVDADSRLKDIIQEQNDSIEQDKIYAQDVLDDLIDIETWQ